ncbi:hypothetical protein ACV1FS_004060 [Citrobacter koseri]
MKNITLIAICFTVFGCSNSRPIVQNNEATYQGQPALSTVQSVYSDEDEKICSKASVEMESEKKRAFSCLDDLVRKLTDKTSIADEVITAAYYSCSNEISSLSKAAYKTTHCNMAKETSKSLLYFDSRLPYDDAKYEGKVKQALYPKLVNDVLTRKQLIK